MSILWTVVLEKTLKSPLECREIKPINLKGNQCLIFIGRTDAEAEAPIFWLPDMNEYQLICKDPEAEKDWRQKEKGMTEDKIARWHHQLNGHGFGWTPGIGDGQGGLACCGSWGHKESDMTAWLNWKLLGRKVMTNLDSILKSRDITLPTKVCPVKAMVFPVVMYGCENWTIKKAEHWKMDAFELCGIGEDSWESLGQQGDPTSPF